jgi:hypothetical protein
MKKLFQNLGSALNSGNLSDAKTALSQLQQNAPPGAANSNNPMSQQIDSLTKAINSGDLKSAQSAYSNIQKAMSQGPMGSASGSGSASSFSGSSDVLKAFLDQLEKSDESKSPGSGSSSLSQNHIQDLLNSLNNSSTSYDSMGSTQTSTGSSNLFTELA